jgi:sec-independent protein translocase protein TatA
MPDIGAPELMLVLLITLFVFGGSKVAEIGGSLGKGIKEFKNAMKEEEQATTASAPASTVAVIAPAQPVCPQCASPNLNTARFCNECGAPMNLTTVTITGSGSLLTQP